VALAPEVILTTTRTFADLGNNGLPGLEKALPGISLTPAGKANRVVVMDDLYLLGFGPRVGDAALELSRSLHGNAGEKVVSKK
jgi:iron complex transport system substrate-binding protein